MSLPFLIKKKDAAPSVHVETRKPDQESPQDESGLEACAQDMLDAFERKDAKLLASALQAAFEICDAQPHEEGPHLNEEESE